MFSAPEPEHFGKAAPGKGSRYRRLIGLAKRWRNQTGLRPQSVVTAGRTRLSQKVVAKAI